MEPNIASMKAFETVVRFFQNDDWNFTRRDGKLLLQMSCGSKNGHYVCLAHVMDEALASGRPEIFNTDQGVQYTTEAFTGRLEAAGVRVSMDGRGRWMDNVFVERLWRTVKHEYLYLREHVTPRALEAGLSSFFPFYNGERIHASLDYRTPMAVYLEA